MTSFSAGNADDAAPNFTAPTGGPRIVNAATAAETLRHGGEPT